MSLDFDVLAKQEQEEFEAQEKESARIKKELAELSLDIESVMGHARGRAFVWRILEFCGIYRDISFEDSPYSAAKRIGVRLVGLHILELISETDEELVFKMMVEAKNVKGVDYHGDRKSDDRKSSDRQPDGQSNNRQSDNRQPDGGQSDYGEPIEGWGGYYDAGESIEDLL